VGSPVLKGEKIRALLARNINAMLETLQWSENELARRSNVSQKQVNNICAARTGCGIDARDAIATAMAVQPWQLIVTGLHLHTEVPTRMSRLLSLCTTASREDATKIETLLKDHARK